MAEFLLKETYDTVRIPAYQPNLYTAGRFRSGSNDVGRKYFNMFPSGTGLNSGSPEVWIEKRQGMTAITFDLSSILGGANTSCLYNITMTQLTDVFVAAIYDSTNSKIVIIQYQPNTSLCTKIGEITGTTVTDQVYLTELSFGNVAWLGVTWHNKTSTSSSGYYAQSVGGLFPALSLTQITDGDFPSNLGTADHLTGPMVQMNGFTFVMGRSGRIYASDADTISAWTATSYVNTGMYPDTGIGICRYKDMLVMFGKDSVEFWTYDSTVTVGLCPLSRTDQAFLKFRCLSPKSFINIDDVLYWIGNSSSSTNGIWRMEGFTPVKVSGQDEDAMVANLSRSIDSMHVGRLWSMMMNAKKHLIIGLAPSLGNGLGIVGGETFPGDTNTLSSIEPRSGMLCMTMDEKEFWLFRDGYTTNLNLLFPMPAASMMYPNTTAQTQYFPGGYVDGPANNIGQKILVIDGQVTNSSQVGHDIDELSQFRPFVCGIQWNGIDFGNTKMKRVHKIHLVQRGLYSGSQTAKLWFVWNKTNNTSVPVAAVIPGQTISFHRYP
jgi:hypothetical protein